MKRKLSILTTVLMGAVLIIGSVAASNDNPKKSSTATVTFTKDVAPILFQHCASCHRPGDIAPMSFLTYEDVRPWAKAIRQQVASGQMPPWHAVAPHGTFSNDRRLSEQEKDTLIRWVGGGALKGDPKDLPPLPKFPVGWEIGTPDVVLSMLTAYDVPAAGTIDYQYFTVPTNFTEDKWNTGHRSPTRRTERCASRAGVLPRAGRYTAIACLCAGRAANASRRAVNGQCSTTQRCAFAGDTHRYHCARH